MKKYAETELSFPHKGDGTVFANLSCKKCYGRGYIGKNLTTGKLVPCKCVKTRDEMNG